MGKSIKEFINELYSFKQIGRITKHDIPGDCKFVADPFILYDPESNLWVIYLEAGFPGRRQFIGILTSPDLTNWLYHGDAVKGSRESFPGIIAIDKTFMMVPCIDASPSPGLVTFYKSYSLLGPWKFAMQINLKEKINDRIIMPFQLGKKSLLVYGTNSFCGPELLSIELNIDNETNKISTGKKYKISKSNPIAFFVKKLMNKNRLLMRPAGAVIKNKKQYYLPLQGTRTGKYGECVSLADIRIGKNNIKIKNIEFFDHQRLCPDFTACHHLSYHQNESKKVFVLDGHTNHSGWEVRVFVFE